jgi:hypothetical protein
MIRKLKSGKYRLYSQKEKSENAKAPEFGNVHNKGGSPETRAGSRVI